MHPAEHQQDETDLCAHGLDGPGRVGWPRAISQGQRNVTDIDQVEPHHQQVVDRIGQWLVVQESVDQEDAPISGKRRATQIVTEMLMNR